VDFAAKLPVAGNEIALPIFVVTALCYTATFAASLVGSIALILWKIRDQKRAHKIHEAIFRENAEKIMIGFHARHKYEKGIDHQHRIDLLGQDVSVNTVGNARTNISEKRPP